VEKQQVILGDDIVAFMLYVTVPKFHHCSKDHDGSQVKTNICIYSSGLVAPVRSKRAVGTDIANVSCTMVSDRLQNSRNFLIVIFKIH
jgi:hypothetical protein